MKLKQFSLNNIVIRTQYVVKRFPLAVLACLIGTVAGIVLIHADEAGQIPNLLLTLTLAAPIFVSLVLVATAKNLPSKQQWLMSTGIILALVGYFFVLPDLGSADTLIYIRHFMWALGFVLLVTFIPFTTEKGRATVLAFWQYNRVLVFSVILTWIWALALQMGISIAMASIDFLFEINIDEERYMELWVILIGTFSPLFFLNRLPDHPEKHETQLAYPKEVRLFSQFVLVPLVSAYFLILYAYTLKILLTTEWPEGQLAYMILGFSFLGVLTYLALYPLRDSVAWIKKAGTVLFAAMIPQVFMLFAALWIRVSEYSITENRYFVLVFGLWLLSMSIYYLVSKQKDIRLIPATLFLLAFLTSFGPWGAFAVSERSQVNRLEGILVWNELLVDGQIVGPVEASTDTEISRDDYTEISAIVRYLHQVHGLDGIQQWFDEDLQALSDAIDEDEWNKSYRTMPEVVVEDLIGIDYTTRWETHRDVSEEKEFEDDGTFSIFSEFSHETIYATNAHAYFMRVDSWEGYMDPAYVVVLSEDDTGVVIRENDVVFIEFSLQEALSDRAGIEYDSGDEVEAFTVEFANEQIEGIMYFDSLFGQEDDGVYEVRSFSGLMFFTIND